MQPDHRAKLGLQGPKVSRGSKDPPDLLDLRESKVWKALRGLRER